MLRAVIIDDEANLVVTAGDKSLEECYKKIMDFLADKDRNVEYQHLEDISVILNLKQIKSK